MRYLYVFLKVKDKISVTVVYLLLLKNMLLTIKIIIQYHHILFSSIKSRSALLLYKFLGIISDSFWKK